MEGAILGVLALMVVVGIIGAVLSLLIDITARPVSKPTIRATATKSRYSGARK